MKKESGFTLIELMVSLALGLGISWVMLDISLNAARNGQDARSSGDVIEKGRYLVGLLQREIKHAGFYGRMTSVGVSSVTPQIDWCTLSPTKDHLTIPIFGLDNVNTLCSNSILSGSDVLMVRRASTAQTAIADMVSQQHYIQSSFDDLIIALGNPTVFLLSEMDGTTVAPIHRFYQDIYFVDTNNNFMRRRLIKGAVTNEPLIEGVDDFQLEYGIDINGDNLADTFSTTPVYNDYFQWQNVKTVTIFLLVSGEESSQEDTKTYNYSDKSNISFSDKKKRRLFNFTVAMGNQY
jgi:type IV pilus assembly protein PilW